MLKFNLAFIRTPSHYNSALLDPVQGVDESLPLYSRHEEYEIMKKKSLPRILGKIK